MEYANGILVGRTGGPKETALDIYVYDPREYGGRLLDMLNSGVDVDKVQGLVDEWNQIMGVKQIPNDIPTSLGKVSNYRDGSIDYVTTHVVLHQGSGMIRLHNVNEKIGS